jgi:hypothetical protein
MTLSMPKATSRRLCATIPALIADSGFYQHPIQMDGQPL